MPPREPASPPTPGSTVAGGAQQEAVAPSPAAGGPSILDFRRTARRLAVAVGVIGVLVVAAWVALALTTGAPLRLLAELAGLGLLAAFVVEVVVVGGSALRGMLAAGERGERLAASDVSLVPPQLLRRRRR